MPGLVPGIHVFNLNQSKTCPRVEEPGGVDGRDQPGHDVAESERE
jgi:hypothetical protein